LQKTFAFLALAACLALAAPAAVRAQAAPPASPEQVVRDFSDWYLGSLNREDYQQLKRRREALRYLTPGFHRRAPRIIASEMVDIFICSQDWQPEWADNVEFSAGPVRGPRARVTATFKYGPENHARVVLDLRKLAGGWKIDGADCGN
jgi:hypothetical protein